MASDGRGGSIFAVLCAVLWGKMRIEHLAYQAEDPVAVAGWYVANAGLSVRRASGAPNYAHFLADSAGNVMIEIYNNPRVRTPDYRGMDPLLLHVAFCSESLEGDRDRLVAAGAEVVEDMTTTPAGDVLVMLRDPWGFAIQLVRRERAMV